MTSFADADTEIYEPNLPAAPRVPGLPLLGNVFDFLYRPMEFFLDNYQKYGPIFQIKAANQRYVIMAGLEANRFFSRDKDEIFSSEPLFGEFALQMGSANFLVALDGEPHRHMRQVMKRGYSKSRLAPHLHLSQENHQRLRDRPRPRAKAPGSQAVCHAAPAPDHRASGPGRTLQIPAFCR